MYEFPIQLATERKAKPDPKTLLFGKTFSDHMFLMNYDAGQGWHDGRIVPYGPLSLDPSTMVFHYAQEVFEGLKAYRTPDGGVQLFRPMENIKRLNSSCDRMCIPALPEDLVLDALKALVKSAEEEAVGNGLLEEARKNGELILQGFFANVYDPSEYTVEFT